MGLFHISNDVCLAFQAELSRLSEIENSLAIFCMATYGEGDPTDNAQDFYDWLQENDDEDLSGLNYTVSLNIFDITQFIASDHGSFKILMGTSKYPIRFYRKLKQDLKRCPKNLGYLFDLFNAAGSWHVGK